MTISRSRAGSSPRARKAPPRTLNRFSSPGLCPIVRKMLSGSPPLTIVLSRISARSPPTASPAGSTNGSLGAAGRGMCMAGIYPPPGISRWVCRRSRRRAHPGDCPTGQDAAGRINVGASDGRSAAMGWDFETEPDYQAKLDWVDRCLTEDVEPLDYVLGDAYDKTDERALAVVRPLQQKVREQGLWAAHLTPELGGQGDRKSVV